MKELPVPTLALSPVAMPRGSLHPYSPIQTTHAHRKLANKNNFAVQVEWARHIDEVREAQRLRYKVFAIEMGARLKAPIPGHDMDRFDDYCEHLLVRDADTYQVIGTYRVLTPTQACRAGGFYSDTEFDLKNLSALRHRMVELGRSCVHPDHRHGGVILALWSALFEFMQRNQLDCLVGCASIPLLHQGVMGGNVAASVWRKIQQTYMVSEEYSAHPHLPLPIDKLNGQLDVEPPALVKGMLRMGARVMGPPAWDPDFNSADLPMLMHTSDIAPRYLRHFAAVRTEA